MDCGTEMTLKLLARLYEEGDKTKTRSNDDVKCQKEMKENGKEERRLFFDGDSLFIFI